MFSLSADGNKHTKLPILYSYYDLFIYKTGFIIQISVRTFVQTELRRLERLGIFSIVFFFAQEIQLL